MTIVRSITAVVGGFLTVVVLSVLTDAVLQYVGVFPPITEQHVYVTWMLAVALAYRVAYTVLGGYVTAWIAPKNKMTHVWVLAGLGLIGGIGGVVAGWNLSAHWYPIAIAVSSIPGVGFGGWLYTKNTLI